MALHAMLQPNKAQVFFRATAGIDALPHVRVRNSAAAAQSTSRAIIYPCPKAGHTESVAGQSQSPISFAAPAGLSGDAVVFQAS